MLAALLADLPRPTPARPAGPAPSYLSGALCAVGFILVGVGVLRERALRGAGRFVPLLCGVFVFVGLLPLVMGGGDLFFLGVGGWSALLATLGIVITRNSRA
ncbi:hypothetical protein I6A60_00190 [Frankia sp. AgB1.9]|uniref:hypothetical protein n=1 Tax=unclassified Frankia TaxID=2632575 RepID=UPI0019322998|nr:MULTISPECIES: hypothetical protein [unclassified Frankia]MBL7487299.1 hypothetical protein [Frankia sp. AgW1.1]MBL7546306.1 hypothetical protein [Frankia sp. AgB1.9]MBL7618649.1 hypothetical protein [Frankia sp. AgB1.8]